MNILLLNWKDIRHPEVGGAEIIVYELAKRLVSHGHNVTWFSQSFYKAKSHEEIDGIRFVRKGSSITMFFHAVVYYWGLKKKPDIVFDLINTIGWQTPLWAWRSRKIAYLNQLAQEVFDYEYSKPIGFIGKFIEQFQYILYRNCQFICYSESTKNDLILMGIPSINIGIFSLGIDHSRYKPGSKSNFPLFICVSRLVKMKRTELAIKAMRYVVKKHPKAKLIIIGYGYERTRLEKIRDHLNLEKSVHFADEDILYLNKNSKDVKVSYMQKAWALIFPSVKEGWGMTVTECAACATPTIATNVSGLSDSVVNENTGILVSKNPSDREIAEAMNLLISDKKMRSKFSEKARKRALAYTWDNSYREFTYLIKQNGLSN